MSLLRAWLTVSPSTPLGESFAGHAPGSSGHFAASKPAPPVPTAVTFLATSPAWGPAVVPALNDVRQLAGGHLVLCMLRSAARLCPPSRLLAMAPEATGEPATGGGAVLCQS